MVIVSATIFDRYPVRAADSTDRLNRSAPGFRRGKPCCSFAPLAGGIEPCMPGLARSVRTGLTHRHAARADSPCQGPIWRALVRPGHTTNGRRKLDFANPLTHASDNRDEVPNSEAHLLLRQLQRLNAADEFNGAWREAGILVFPDGLPIPASGNLLTEASHPTRGRVTSATSVFAASTGFLRRPDIRAGNGFSAV